MFVLWSVLVVSGCSGKQTEEMESKVVSEVEISETDVAGDCWSTFLVCLFKNEKV